MSENQLSRPEKVKTAVTLLYITLVAGLLRGIMEASRLTHGAPIGIVIFMVFTFAILCIMWLLIHLIGKGKNWSRILYLVLLLIGLPFSIKPFQQSFAANVITGVLGIGQTILQIIAMVLLFQRSSSDWYKQMEANKKN